jgi:Kef-type K+ transport system membrane component KefB
MSEPESALTGTAEWLHALRHLSVEDLLLPLLIQLSLIILAARAFASLARRLRQPGVVGEVAAGLVLGPSLFGRFFPEAFGAIFHPTTAEMQAPLFDALLGWVLTAVAQLGLIFLLFLIGLEFDFSHLRWRGRAALAIALAGIALPFGLGLAAGQVLHPVVAQGIDPVGFSLFLGTALSITAIPVLGRIMLELNITRTRLGTVTIAAAAADDAAGWVLLASVAAVVRAQSQGGHFDPLQTLVMIGETAAFALFMIVAARPLLCRGARLLVRPGNGELSVNGLSIVLVVLFACATLTNRIGIFAVFGGFLLGAVLSSEHAFRQAVTRRLCDFVTAFFLPVFFAYTGLRTDVGTLGSAHLWALCGLLCSAAIVGKLFGCGLAAWLSGYTPREAACIGTMMNTRALMALVVINLGKDLGVVPDSVFCMLVLMALLTTVLTTPLLLYLMKGTELEPYVLRSGFLGSPVEALADPTSAKRACSPGPRS